MMNAPCQSVPSAPRRRWWSWQLACALGLCLPSIAASQAGAEATGPCSPVPSTTLTTDIHLLHALDAVPRDGLSFALTQQVELPNTPAPRVTVAPHDAARTGGLGISVFDAAGDEIPGGLGEGSTWQPSVPLDASASYSLLAHIDNSGPCFVDPAPQTVQFDFVTEADIRPPPPLRITGHAYGYLWSTAGAQQRYCCEGAYAASCPMGSGSCLACWRHRREPALVPLLSGPEPAEDERVIEQLTGLSVDFEAVPHLDYAMDMIPTGVANAWQVLRPAAVSGFQSWGTPTRVCADVQQRVQRSAHVRSHRLCSDIVPEAVHDGSSLDAAPLDPARFSLRSPEPHATEIAFPCNGVRGDVTVAATFHDTLPQDGIRIETTVAGRTGSADAGVPVNAGVDDRPRTGSGETQSACGVASVGAPRGTLGGWLAACVFAVRLRRRAARRQPCE